MAHSLFQNANLAFDIWFIVSRGEFLIARLAQFNYLYIYEASKDEHYACAREQHRQQSAKQKKTSSSSNINKKTNEDEDDFIITSRDCVSLVNKTNYDNASCTISNIHIYI